MGAPSVTVTCAYCGAPGEGPLRTYHVRKGAKLIPRTTVDSPPGWGRRGDRATGRLKDVCPECADKLRSGELKG
jgi:hypothetical protein